MEKVDTVQQMCYTSHLLVSGAECRSWTNWWIRRLASTHRLQAKKLIWVKPEPKALDDMIECRLVKICHCTMPWIRAPSQNTCHALTLPKYSDSVDTTANSSAAGSKASDMQRPRFGSA